MSRCTDLTLCTVSFHSKPWLELNWALTAQQNPEQAIRWMIAENSPSESPLKLLENDSRFTVIPGAAFEKRPYAAGSYHHAAGMNKILSRINSRYALFLDPDFFIIRPQWISTVIRHMQTNELAFLGVPWHPKHTLKPRYFPCVHCLFVDLEQIPVETLDFSPDYPALPGYKNPKTGGMIDRILRLLGNRLDLFRWQKRRYIGISRDVSWRIHEYYFGHSQYRVECLQPVFRPSLSWLQSSVEKYLPDRLSFIPKRDGYFTKIGFREHNLMDLDSLGWEEFIWQGQPFGFHLRQNPKRTSKESMHSRYHYDRVVEFLKLSSAPTSFLAPVS
ncbi:MAG TPA: hypothetical protein VJ508_05175 [Saprospiraceae bacterium]|nr:hypothetical protein [Saprospiraceae bacterium]